MTFYIKINVKRVKSEKSDCHENHDFKLKITISEGTLNFKEIQVKTLKITRIERRASYNVDLLQYDFILMSSGCYWPLLKFRDLRGSGWPENFLT